MPEEKKSKPRGRPSSGKRAKFNFRLTDDLRYRLADAAEKDGRPVSEVIESRLEQSFANDLLEGFGISSNPRNLELMKRTLLCAILINNHFEPWMVDKNSQAILIAAFSELVSPTDEAFLKRKLIAAELAGPDAVRAFSLEHQGRHLAKTVSTPAGIFGLFGPPSTEEPKS